MVHVFIVNPIAGISDKTEYIRNVLAEREDIQYIVFSTEEAGDEYRITREVREIFDDEVVRIYVCGGSGTLSNVLNALDDNDWDHVEIGFYPCGLTNDFLKNFGQNRSKFEDLNAIIDGKVRMVDFMHSHGDETGEIMHNDLLFSSVGITAQIQDLANAFNAVGKMRPTILYSLCALLSMPFCNASDYELTIDGVDYSGEYKLAYIGNSVCMGGGFFPIRKNISCQDGIINVFLIKNFPMWQFLRYIRGFMNGDLAEKESKTCIVTAGKHVVLKRKDNKPMIINSDGEIHKDEMWDMQVIHNKLKFIVPRDAEFSHDFDEMYALADSN